MKTELAAETVAALVMKMDEEGSSSMPRRWRYPYR